MLGMLQVTYLFFKDSRLLRIWIERNTSHTAHPSTTNSQPTHKVRGQYANGVAHVTHNEAGFVQPRTYPCNVLKVGDGGGLEL